jgi:hypothetical protein
VAVATVTSIDVHYSGPMFDGRAAHEVTAFLGAATREVAKVGQDDVGIQLIKVIRHPTGYYESHIAIAQAAPTIWRVHDSGVIYGPWLEGVGSRNFPVTRFKGYFTFRKVAITLRLKAGRIASSVLPPYIRRMNG